jgi:hypothetical protein
LGRGNGTELIITEEEKAENLRGPPLPVAKFAACVVDTGGAP